MLRHTHRLVFGAYDAASAPTWVEEHLAQATAAQAMLDAAVPAEEPLPDAPLPGRGPVGFVTGRVTPSSGLAGAGRAEVAAQPRRGALDRLPMHAAPGVAATNHRAAQTSAQRTQGDPTHIRTAATVRRRTAAEGALCDLCSRGRLFGGAGGGGDFLIAEHFVGSLCATQLVVGERSSLSCQICACAGSAERRRPLQRRQGAARQQARPRRRSPIARQQREFQKRRTVVAQQNVRSRAQQRVAANGRPRQPARRRVGPAEGLQRHQHAPACDRRPLSKAAEAAEAAKEHARLWGTQAAAPAAPQRQPRPAQRTNAPPKRRCSADGCLQTDTFHGHGAPITISDSESDGSPAACRSPGVLHKALPCCSDPGVVRAASAAGSAAESCQGDDVNDGAESAPDAHRSRRGVLAALLLRIERSPERGAGHMYWSDDGEPGESEIAGSWEHSDGSDGVRRRCALLDDDASSDGAAAPGGAAGDQAVDPAGLAEAGAHKRRRRGLFKGTGGAASTVRPTWGADDNAAQEQLHPRCAPGQAVLARLDAADADMASSEEESEGAVPPLLAGSDSESDAQHAREDLHAEVSSPEHPAEDFGAGTAARSVDAGQPRLTAAQRRRARREAKEAEWRAANPEQYERVVAMRRNTLAPFGWDKCALENNCLVASSTTSQRHCSNLANKCPCAQKREVASTVHALFAGVGRSTL